MNDIYKQKAEKYKYKYLKLKQELEGGTWPFKNSYTIPAYVDYDNHGDWVNEKEITKQRRTTNVEDCTTTYDFSNDQLEKLEIKQEYPETGTRIKDFDNWPYKEFIIKYSKRLLSYDDYKKELNNFLLIQELDIDIDKTYIRKIVFGGKIENFNYNFFNKSEKSKILKNRFSSCKILNKNYGYIIYEDINKKYKPSNILKLECLITAINDFIKPLHKAGFVLNNIVWDNIIVSESKTELDSYKLIFDISKMEASKNTNKDIKALYKLGYKLIENDIDIINKINPNKLSDNDNLIEILNNIKNHIIQ
jgi:hypothetical protein